MTAEVISIKTLVSRRVSYDKEAFPIYNNDWEESIILREPLKTTDFALNRLGDGPRSF